MQFKHVTLDFDGPVAVQARPSGGHEHGLDGHLGGLGEALDAINDSEMRCAASC